MNEETLRALVAEFGEPAIHGGNWPQEIQDRWWELVEHGYPYQAKLAIGKTNPAAVVASGILPETADLIYHTKPNGVAWWGFQTEADLDIFCVRYDADKL